MTKDRNFHANFINENSVSRPIVAYCFFYPYEPISLTKIQIPMITVFFILMINMVKMQLPNKAYHQPPYHRLLFLKPRDHTPKVFNYPIKLL